MKPKKKKLYAFPVSSTSEAYSEPYQTSKMKCFAKIINSSKLLTTVAKRSIFDVWKISEYASQHHLYFSNNCKRSLLLVPLN